MNGIDKLFALPTLPFLIGVFLIIIILRELLTAQKNITGKYILTPLITITTLVIALTISGETAARSYTFWIIIGITFSLVGDTLMMITETDLFQYGLLFFLGTQISFIIAFSTGYTFQLWNGILAGILIILLIVIHYKFKRKDVLVYTFFLLLMTFFAYGNLNNGVSARSLFMVTGATLFIISDFLIAVNAFLIEIPHSSVVVWSLYGPSLLCVALSCYAAPY